MPEAGDSNSISARPEKPRHTKSRPMIDSLYDLAQALDIYSTMLERLVDTPLMREIADLRRRVTNQLGPDAGQASPTPLADQAMADYCEMMGHIGGYRPSGAPAFGDSVAPDIRALRTDFIRRALHAGHPEQRVAQILNIHTACIHKVGKRLRRNSRSSGCKGGPPGADNAPGADNDAPGADNTPGTRNAHAAYHACVVENRQKQPPG